jgi:hypothetical protein
VVEAEEDSEKMHIATNNEMVEQEMRGRAEER